MLVGRNQRGSTRLRPTAAWKWNLRTRTDSRARLLQTKIKAYLEWLGWLLGVDRPNRQRGGTSRTARDHTKGVSALRRSQNSAVACVVVARHVGRFRRRTLFDDCGAYRKG